MQLVKSLWCLITNSRNDCKTPECETNMISKISNGKVVDFSEVEYEVPEEAIYDNPIESSESEFDDDSFTNENDTLADFPISSCENYTDNLLTIHNSENAEKEYKLSDSDFYENDYTDHYCQESTAKAFQEDQIYEDIEFVSVPQCENIYKSPSVSSKKSAKPSFQLFSKMKLKNFSISKSKKKNKKSNLISYHENNGTMNDCATALYSGTNNTSFESTDDDYCQNNKESTSVLLNASESDSNQSLTSNQNENHETDTQKIDQDIEFISTSTDNYDTEKEQKTIIIKNSNSKSRNTGMIRIKHSKHDNLSQLDECNDTNVKALVDFYSNKIF